MTALTVHSSRDGHDAYGDDDDAYDEDAHDGDAHDEDGYMGAAVLEIDGRSLPVRGRLAGYFQPLDGRYHWYGRLQADAELAELVGSGRADAVLRTPHGQATGTLGDPDLWQRYRIEGVGRPPFPVPVSVVHRID
ncbi:hypothetical protein GCM10009759_63450 [Kitasatospora saccharophila]|uniref:DUF4873 domain-containing protein n=1 Tax=Kitasatospora saccharophila TaxID=407973 RepID=A0ABN2XSQ6_9ACTN